MNEMSDSWVVTQHLGGPALSEFRLQKLALDLGVASGLQARFVHLMQSDGPLSETDQATARLLLRYGAHEDAIEPDSAPRALVLPRRGTVSPWSSKATDIFHTAGLRAVRRVERGVFWYAPALPENLAPLYDRMTEEVFAVDDLRSVFATVQPRPLAHVRFGNDGRAALHSANTALGLALSDDEIEYLLVSYSRMGRDPTDAELMMFAQANSEHCRHKIFNADWLIDAQPQPRSLFQMIRNTHAQINGEGILSAYADNAAVIEGPVGERFYPDATTHRYGYHAAPLHVLMKVETHNHPTGIAPFAGAATGSGGEIRDEGAVGRGSKPKAGLTGFTTSHLNLPEFAQPWELRTPVPEHMASPLQIMLEGPIGAAGFNNEYGRPALCGYFRTFEQAGAESGLVHGYHKPIMIAGGVGSVRAEHVHSQPFPDGTALVVLGGPAMLIGLGGGAASSVASGTAASELDFASVQRDNAEMERRCQEVIDACCARGDDNPILLIHDVGAGGLSNALPELIDDGGGGGRLQLRDIPNADPGMSPLEIWCNEAQERYVLGIAEAALEAFAAICTRERCPFAVVGHATKDGHLAVEDALFDNKPVDVELDMLLGKPPKMTRTVVRRQRTLAPLTLPDLSVADALALVLRFPAVASKKFLITIGDRSISGLVAREQMVGPWQVPVADVAATKAGFATCEGEVFAMGERPALALTDAAASARMAVAEALTNMSAAGGVNLSRVVLSANWMAAAGGNQEEQDLFDAVQAVGMELCPALGIAIPVGKDSLSMRTRVRGAGKDLEVRSPLSLIVSAFAPCTDVARVLTPEPRLDAGPTELLLVDLGAGARRLGGSALAQCLRLAGGAVPDVDCATRLADFFRTVQQLHADNLLLGLSRSRRRWSDDHAAGNGLCRSLRSGGGSARNHARGMSRGVVQRGAGGGVTGADPGRRADSHALQPVWHCQSGHRPAANPRAHYRFEQRWPRTVYGIARRVGGAVG